METLKIILWGYPLWVSGLAFLFTLLLAFELGSFTGRKRSHVWRNADAGGGSIALSSMLALLGLLLAFTFSNGVSRHEARKHSMIVEANVISTAFLRADLVAEPERRDLKRKLFEYGQTRFTPDKAVLNPAQLRARLDEADQLLNELWQIAVRIEANGARGPLEALVIASINEVIDQHTIRATAILDRLPTALFIVLILVGSTSMGLAGFNAGLLGKVSRPRMAALAIVLAGVMLEILDYDRSTTGLIQIDQGVMTVTVAGMESALNGE